MNNNQCLINVVSQYYENYGFHGWDGTGVCPQGWKPKGGSYFRLVVDVDDVMYGEEVIVGVIKEVLKGKSDNLNRFEYLSHEVIFEEPEDITGEFNELMKKRVEV